MALGDRKDILVKVDRDVGDCPFAESRVDATLTQKFFGAAVDVVEGTEGTSSLGGGAAASSSTGAEGVIPNTNTAKPKAAWKQHVGVWLESIKKTVESLEYAGKDLGR